MININMSPVTTNVEWMWSGLNKAHGLGAQAHAERRQFHDPGYQHTMLLSIGTRAQRPWDRAHHVCVLL